MTPSTNAGFGNATTIAQSVPVWVTNGGGSQAACYAFYFNLAILQSAVGSYSQIAQMYDHFKLFKVELILTPRVDPRVAVNVSNQTATYNFTDWPGSDPVISYVDYDGYNPMLNAGVAGVQQVPANGDMTQLLMNKVGARRHKAWRTIRRTFVPRNIILQANKTVLNLPQFGVPSFSLDPKPAGWRTSIGSQDWTGQLIVAFPYWGNQAGSPVANQQPNAVYDINNKWYVGLKAPLFG